MRLLSFRVLMLTLIFALPAAAASIAAAAGPFVPGTGSPVPEVGDDFEDSEWDFVPNWPKSSYENDKRTRNPGGFSKNGRWFEPSKRGQPDYVKRIETPPGGLPGSEGALLLRTLQSGIPGNPSHQNQQDDFVANVTRRLGVTIPVYNEPSIVTRLYLPPVDQWENRSGSQFAFRAGCRGLKDGALEEYWPGIFVQFQSETDSKTKQDAAFFVIRADGRGRDIRGPEITQTGWWTLGMSFTMDGKVHYYLKPGVDDLTTEDYITTYIPYSMPCRQFDTMFFDCFNRDDGKSWSTPFVIDDPSLYVIRGYEQLTAGYNRRLASQKAVSQQSTTSSKR
jgi:hypothetical protein